MNAKPIIICILATLSLSSLAFAEKSGRYVNSREGLNIRAESNAGADKVEACENAVKKIKAHEFTAFSKTSDFCFYDELWIDD